MPENIPLKTQLQGSSGPFPPLPLSRNPKTLALRAGFFRQRDRFRVFLGKVHECFPFRSVMKNSHKI